LTSPGIDSVAALLRIGLSLAIEQVCASIGNPACSRRRALERLLVVDRPNRPRDQ
jgi:hypothetical protein